MLTPLQKFPKNVRDLGKLIVTKGLKKLPKVQKIAQSGHTACQLPKHDICLNCVVIQMLGNSLLFLVKKQDLQFSLPKFLKGGKLKLFIDLNTSNSNCFLSLAMIKIGNH